MTIQVSDTDMIRYVSDMSTRSCMKYQGNIGAKSWIQTLFGLEIFIQLFKLMSLAKIIKCMSSENKYNIIKKL